MYQFVLKRIRAMDQCLSRMDGFRRPQNSGGGNDMRRSRDSGRRRTRRSRLLSSSSCTSMITCVALMPTINFPISIDTTTTCMVLAQEIDDIILVMDETMKRLCFIPCDNGFVGNEVIPGTKCQWYHYCSAGVRTNIIECGDGLYFDSQNGYCSPQSLGFDCPPDPSCTSLPTYMPTDPPPPVPAPITTSYPRTEYPTGISTYYLGNDPQPISSAPDLTPQPTRRPTGAPFTPSPTIDTAIAHIESKREQVEDKVLVSYDGDTGLSFPSTQYTYDAMLQSLRTMGVAGFGADFKFWLWEGERDKYHYGLVNLAAFLANAMVESIEHDSCDELNWQNKRGLHAISNSCGQEGRSYEDENCPKGSYEFYSCDVDKDMQVTAVHKGSQSNAPPPLKCKAGSGRDQFTGHWDANVGLEFKDEPYENAAGRTDIEGCCFWGRGALSTRGVCNIGKINYHLGKRGADFGHTTMYPTIDFCKFPEATCTSSNGEHLRWTTGLFEWAERIQRYEIIPSSTVKGWSYEDELIKFVDGGMIESDASDSFFSSVCRILTRGCHEPDCGGEARLLKRRRENFFMIIKDVFDVESIFFDQQNEYSPARPTPTLPVSVAPPVQPPVMTPPQQSMPSPKAPNPGQDANPFPGTQSEQGLTNGGDGEGSVYDDTNDGELISLEGNVACRISALQTAALALAAAAILHH